MGGDGTCKTCADFSKISANKKSCDNPNCLNDGSKATTVDGTCVAVDKCPSYTKFDEAGGKKLC